MSNTKNTKYYIINNTADTVPASTQGTGTVVAGAGDKGMVGTGTLFTTELQKGDWIADITHNEVRRIIGILNNTDLQIEQGFTNAQSGSFYFVKSSRARAITVACDNVAVTIDGAAMFATGSNGAVTFDKSSIGSPGSHSPTDFIDPIIVGASGHNAYITLLY